MIEGLVSVVMPCFNTARYVTEAVASILAQTHRDFELIAIDDGSTDGTVAALQGIADPRLQIIRNSTNLGIVETLNIGVAEARGEFVARMDADDVALPQRFERQVAFLRRNIEFAAVGTGVSYMDEHGAAQRSPRLPPNSNMNLRWRLLLGNCVHHPTIMFRRSQLSLPVYSSVYPDIEDYELFLRLAVAGVLANMPERLLRMRRHGLSVSGQRHHAQLDSAAMLLHRHCAAEYGLAVTATEFRGVLDPLSWLHPKRSVGTAFAAVDNPVTTVRRLRSAFAGKHPGLDHSEVTNIDDDQAFFLAKVLSSAIAGSNEASLARRLKLSLSAATACLCSPRATLRAVQQDRSRQ
ncbi:MAG: glycosyltransferase family 2 protein [Gammaproteobacteria bacterium]